MNETRDKDTRVLIRDDSSGGGPAPWINIYERGGLPRSFMLINAAQRDRRTLRLRLEGPEARETAQALAALMDRIADPVKRALDPFFDKWLLGVASAVVQGYEKARHYGIRAEDAAAEEGAPAPPLPAGYVELMEERMVGMTAVFGGAVFGLSPRGP